MKVEYDNYYQSENLFGKAYPELIDFYAGLENKGKLLDLGCGQGRDAIPLAEMGFEVIGIDNSKVGIHQLNQVALKQNLTLEGIVEDIFTYSSFDQFDHVLLDSMFHFGKKEREKEIAFLNRIFTDCKSETIINICIQKIGRKLETLLGIISSRSDLVIHSQTTLTYKFVDTKSDHNSETKYEMVVLKKIG